MIDAKKFQQIVEEIAPLNYQYEWDNSGWNIFCHDEIERVITCLDVTDQIVEEAVEAARVNAKLNGLDNCSFIAGDVLKVVDDLTEKPDLIVLDPPRDGIHPKALPKIIAFDVPTIVYVSCKPTSLVRDREVLEAAGYRMVKARAVDMFPATGGIETVALFLKK